MTGTPRELPVPATCLIVLVGISGSGKSTFAQRNFLPTQVVSSDFCRGLVSDDENDQSASADAFDVMHYIVGKRLAAFRTTVVDATNVQPFARKQLVELAREHDVLPVAIVLNPPVQVCLERNAGRSDRNFGQRVLHRQHSDLRGSLRKLEREGFRHVHVLDSVDDVDSATVTYTRLRSDLTHLHGPFDVIGDVHGCLGELRTLLTELGYQLRHDDEDRLVGAHHPDGRTAAFVGDLVDRGPDSPGVLRLVMGMVADGDALCVPGNHEQKLVRKLAGRKVTVGHGLAETLEQLDREPPEFREQVRQFCDGLVAHLVLDDGNLVVAHAGLKEKYHNRTSGRVRSFALYGDTTGETDEYGLPVRLPWAKEYRGKAMVLYGHTPMPEPEWVNNTMCLDTGCAFGGRLTAMRYPEKQLVSVPAERVWYEPAKPFPPNDSLTPADGGARIESPVLDLNDVTTGGVQTAYQGHIAVREGNAAAALELMSRFAIDPRLLLYLPPTMAPCATSRAEGLLEHPEEAFTAYRVDGLATVVCEEKHMGSRAVALLCRDEATARHRFGVDGVNGAVYTRTGRSFFDQHTTAELVDRLRAAADDAGLWRDLDADWVLLDAELLPWSAKAEGLIKERYAPVGAAARVGLDAAVASLRATSERDVEVGDLLERTVARVDDTERFTAAYRRYCWPTDGLSGVRFAPFQLLAAGKGQQGLTYHKHAHRWHLALADRLAESAPDLLQPTNRLLVDLADDDSVAAGAAWWEELTAAGGEGMVVKPADGSVVRSSTGRLVQPGVKCRGSEYLRMIYGPEYTEPANLERLRNRNLGRKLSLALREHALGLEALDRVARGEPLWRVHECVFAVLALEAEPVDPRL
ncbi:MAG: polynucleotide kinase-phosphatase [Streptosporangiales bacterium]|nr:polynucleotide kinase-phosphatase [Streptosporangiales bacterium]